MKKKLKNKLIILFAGIVMLLFLGGCAMRQSLDEVLTDKNLKAQVTYYSNGGIFDRTQGSTEKNIYYKSGSKPLNIGVSTITSNSISIERNNYEFDGWYHAVLDSEGNPVYEDEEKGLIKLGEKADFSTVLEEGDHWKLVAKWQINVMVQVKLACEDAEAKLFKKGTEESYSHGDVVSTLRYDSNTGEVLDPGFKKVPFEVKDNTYTFYAYYADEECTEAVAWPLKKGETQTEDAFIYAKYIPGDWNFLRTSSDVIQMFSGVRVGKHYWLMNDIDMTGKQIAMISKSEFKGEIQGNNYSIKNLTVNNVGIPSGQKLSLFGNIQSTAKIENLTFSNVSISYTVRNHQEVKLYFVCQSIAEGAVISNVKLSGKMTIKTGENVAAWGLYGEQQSDEAYIEATQGNAFLVEGDNVIEIIR